MKGHQLAALGILTVIACFCCAQTSRRAAADDTAIYGNARYGFAVAYPKTWKVVESDNGDGAAISNADRTVTLRAFAEYDVGLYDNVDELINSYKTTFQKDCSGAITESGMTPVTVKKHPGKRFQFWCKSGHERTVVGAVVKAGQVYFSLLVEEDSGETPSSSSIGDALFQRSFRTWTVSSQR